MRGGPVSTDPSALWCMVDRGRHHLRSAWLGKRSPCNLSGNRVSEVGWRRDDVQRTRLSSAGGVSENQGHRVSDRGRIGRGVGREVQ